MDIGYLEMMGGCKIYVYVGCLKCSIRFNQLQAHLKMLYLKHEHSHVAGVEIEV